KAERPESAIIFCNTREDTSTVAKYLVRHGYDAEAISSDLTQRDRERVMKRSRDKTLAFLVATDIAARGIDISDLSHVINYQFPESPEVYVHRTGRTGRAGKTGVAVSLIGPREIGAFYYLKLIYKIRPEERELPSAEELLTMQEGEQYERVVGLVPEVPSQQYLSLARRLWQSVEGERVVGALLQRLLSGRSEAAAERPPRRLESAPRSSAEPTDRLPVIAEGEEAGRAVRAAGEVAGAAGEATGEAAGGEEEPRRRRRRRPEGGDARGRDRDRDRGRGRTRERVSSRSGPRDRDRDRDRREPVRMAERAPEGERAAEKPDAEKSDFDTRDTAPRPVVPMPSRSSEDGREFWEAWADEKSTRGGGPGDVTDPVAELPALDDLAGDDVVEGDLTARLYVNIGKREEATADDIRELLSQDLGDDAARIGSVALRNTHAYVRVPEDLVDRVIEATRGKSYKERELVVERARR
ncbi:MAG TPA: helicase-related protein, partial [Kofleriaceae bacterium]|nr:helicase-related protein [Kofleriaceae bacterium]